MLIDDKKRSISFEEKKFIDEDPDKLRTDEFAS